jgi:hypothetical protein
MEQHSVKENRSIVVASYCTVQVEFRRYTNPGP